MYMMTAKTSKWTLTAEHPTSAVAAMEGIIPKVAAVEGCDHWDAMDLLAALEMSGELIETLTLDGVEVDQFEHL